VNFPPPSLSHPRARSSSPPPHSPSSLELGTVSLGSTTFLPSTMLTKQSSSTNYKDKSSNVQKTSWYLQLKTQGQYFPLLLILFVSSFLPVSFSFLLLVSHFSLIIDLHFLSLKEGLLTHKCVHSQLENNIWNIKTLTLTTFRKFGGS
jgi:hypothetical protein